MLVNFTPQKKCSPNHSIQNNVAFCAAKPDATKKSIQIAKDAFIKLEKFDKTEIDEKEMESFTKAVQSIFKKVKQNFEGLKKSELPNRSIKVDNIGETEVHAYKLWNGYYFEQHSKGDTKGLKGLEIVPSLNHARIYSFVEGDNSVTKEAMAKFDSNESKAVIKYTQKILNTDKTKEKILDVVL